jgi:hypothetical protein
MVLKAIGYGLWVNLIQRAAPHLDHHRALLLRRALAVALQVAFERQILKPFILI